MSAALARAKSVRSLARLDDEEVFRQAATLVADTGMAAPATKDLVRKIKAKPSENARLELIGTEGAPPIPQEARDAA